jgi:hypothetical protein
MITKSKINNEQTFYVLDDNGQPLLPLDWQYEEEPFEASDLVDASEGIGSRIGKSRA